MTGAHESSDEYSEVLERGRILKLAGSLWTGAVLLFGGGVLLLLADLSEFPFVGGSIGILLGLGMLIVPITGLYVSTTPADHATVKDRSEGERLSRRTWVSVVAGDWIALVFGGALVMGKEMPSESELVVGMLGLVTAASMGALLAIRLTSLSSAYRVLIGLSIAFVPGLSYAFEAFRRMEKFFPGGDLIIFVLAPIGIQMLLFSDALLILGGREDEPSTGGNSGGRVEEGFEVLDRASE